jgi:hypothetical protein
MTPCDTVLEGKKKKKDPASDFWSVSPVQGRELLILGLGGLVIQAGKSLVLCCAESTQAQAH